MSHELFAIIVIISMILLNGLLSMSEMAVVSSRKQRLIAKAGEGRASYLAVLGLVESPTAFLSTIQIGITLIGILSGAYGEETIARSLQLYFQSVPAIASYSNALSTGVVVITITFITILFGELIPKRVALSSPERIASLVVYPMKILSIMFMPLVRLFTVITNLVMTGIGAKRDGKAEPPITEEEIKVLIKEGEAFGLIKKQQVEMVEGVIDLHGNRIASIMSPRPDIKYIEITETGKKIKERIIELGDYPYLPVCRNGLDHVVGVIKTRDVLRKIIKGEYKSLSRHLEKPMYAPESISPLKVLELFKINKSHVAFVIDEYGGVTGLVTMHDVIEEIVGEVPEFTEEGNPRITRRKNGSYLVDGMVSVDDFIEHFKVDIAGEGNYNTLAGFIMERIGRIPRAGETLAYGGYSFEVVDMDGNRIDKVLVKKIT
ncbi:MAG: HlyC/CorC family transporter [Spirochaetes bacterium]|nr:HlyC/CorC family transporter [Spirochaetota bacterium]